MMLRRSETRWTLSPAWQPALIVTLLSGSFAAWSPPARAQIQIQIRQQQAQIPRVVQARGVVQRRGEGESLDESAIFRSDREPMLWLKTAKELLAERRYGEATRYLGRILEGEEDFFFQPDDEKPVYHSLKSEAQRLIGRMPLDGRQSYELQYGAHAQSLLDEAAAAGKIRGVADVARGMFHTDAGYEATYLLGTHYMNHDRPLAAALCFERLLEAPSAADRFEPALSTNLALCWVRAAMPQRAEGTLAALQARHADAIVAVAGKPVKLFGDQSKALEWLETTFGPQRRRAPVKSDQWVMYRGGPSRNVISRGGAPLLEAQWRVPTTNDPHVEKMVANLCKAYRDRELTAIPSLSPLVVDDIVLMRTTLNLLAVDFHTGKRLWEIPVDEDADAWLSGSAAGTEATQSASITATGLDQRLWDDATYGTLSSDGRLVYSIEDLPIWPSFGQQIDQRIVIMPNGRRNPMASRNTRNRLAAHEIRTGKLKWELGAVDDEAIADDERDTFFLGPPLPLEDKLYAIADVAGEIRMLVIEPSTGEIEWSQQLAVVERDLSQDPGRGRSGASPSYADGVLVCPTSAGAVVAVDLTTRSLLWGYRYPRTSFNLAAVGARLRGVMFARNSRANADHWSDACVTIADGRVLLTPVESHELHCLNLLDGTLNWKIPREENLFIAGVLDGVVYLVGRSQLRAISLETGESLWTDDQVPLPGGSHPSGRGFLSDNHYYLPLTAGEVAEFDLAEGRLTGRSKSRHDRVPGNLICYRGAIISQGVDAVERFHQLTALKRQVASRLDADPMDPAALAWRAEIHLDAGRLPQAIEDLRKSFQRDPDPRTRQLLVIGLLAALASDFDAHRQAADELESLIESPSERVAFLRLMARGLARGGDHAGALARYLKLIESSTDFDSLDEVAPGVFVRRDRWVRAELASLKKQASPDERRAVNATIERHFKAAVEDGSSEALRRFVAYFGDSMLVDEARQLLAESLTSEGALLDAELQLLRLEKSHDPAIGYAATARLAQFLTAIGRPTAAAVYYERLRGPLADVECLDGKTGRQLYAELSSQDPVRRIIEQPASWPAGEVEKERETTQATVYRYFNIDMLGGSAPFFSGVQVQLDQGRSLLIARDGAGREMWSVPLIDPTEGAAAGAINPSIVHAKVHGHLLLVSAGQTTFAIDALEPSGGARVLWSRGLTEIVPGVPLNATVHAGQESLAWGGQRAMVADAHGKRAGLLGAVNSELVCLSADREMTALDPLTGETLWKRSDVPPGCEVFGDNELLFAVPGDGSEAFVLRPLDGELVGRRSVPPSNVRMTSLGRLLLVWNSRGNAIELFDPWTGKTLWKRSFQADSKACLVGQQAVAVVEPRGRFLLFDLPSGRTLNDTPIEPEPRLDAVYMLPSREQYVLVVSRAWRNNRGGVYVSTIPGGTNNPLVDGYVYGFDSKSGNRLWSREVEPQGLLLDQPAELPVLVFASRVYQRGVAGRPRSETYYPVLCLDKRTGAVLHEEKVSSHFGSFELTGDPEHDRVNLRLLRDSIRMRFTGRPVSPRDEAKEDDAGENDEDDDSPDERADEPAQPTEEQQAGEPLPAPAVTPR